MLEFYQGLRHRLTAKALGPRLSYIKLSTPIFGLLWSVVVNSRSTARFGIWPLLARFNLPLTFD